MGLRCVSAYKSVYKFKQVVIDPGQTVEGDAELEAFLLADSPGSFEPMVDSPSQPSKVPSVATELGENGSAKAIESAPADKMVKRPVGKKAKNG